ncbi:MAG: DUF2239 family protein [Chlorobium sp.]
MTGQAREACTAFEGSRALASGELVLVAEKVKEMIDRGEALSVLIFDDLISELIEVDFRGTIEDVLLRLKKPAVTEEPAHPRGPGRPKLGVVPREVTLLPRHWEWLNAQPGGTSVALRKLVEEARRVNTKRDLLRSSQASLYRFISAMAGDLPGFEEASRALFARDPERFNQHIASWPVDIQSHVQKLSVNAFCSKGTEGSH